MWHRQFVEEAGAHRQREIARQNANDGVWIPLILDGLAKYIALAVGDPFGVQWKSEAVGIHQVLNWVRDHPSPPGAVAADNPALVYLYTGRRTVAIDSYDEKWARWRRMGVRYVVSLVHGLPLVDPRAELRFKLPDRNAWAYELLPESPAAQSVASTTHMPDRVVLNSTR